nr:helitron helicase-like domain-containing protein [Tanacetum cinerariifolium]
MGRPKEGTQMFTLITTFQKRQPQTKCGKIHTAEKRVADEFINKNGQIIFRAFATSRIGHRQKQYATRIHRHISDDQRVAPLKKVPFEYGHLGKATCTCRHYGAMIWECEKHTRLSTRQEPQYIKCCHGGRMILYPPPGYPQYIKDLYKDAHFINNIRAYNRMFSMTSLGANVDNSINNGKGPYQGKFIIGEDRCAQKDTANDVNNRMVHFGGNHQNGFKKEIVQDLIEFLDNHNALVQLFLTVRDKHMDSEIPKFKVRLYNVVGTWQYDVPTPETIGAIVFGDSSTKDNEFDLIVEEHSRFPQRFNKLHSCYMLLQFPLLFVYGEEGYNKGLKLANVHAVSTKGQRQKSMNMYYSYQIHDRLNHYSLLTGGGKLFQQYVVTAYCAIEQDRLDYIRKNLSEIRNEYLLGLYDAIMRGDRDCSDLGTRLMDMFTIGGVKLESTQKDKAYGLKGCRSILEIRTVNNTLYPTNKAACEALGILGGDQEWIEALQEAKESATSLELRKLFVQILMFCEVSNPMSLWHMFFKDMSDDIPQMLNSNSKSLKDFGLPRPPQDILKILQNKLLMEEKNYNPDLLVKENDVLIPRLNTEQKDIFDAIVNTVNDNIQKLVFVYGHTGTGKTFMWKAITCGLRSAEKVILAVASSGIASLLLPSGSTAHARFKIPLKLNDESICNIKKKQSSRFIARNGFNNLG